MLESASYIASILSAIFGFMGLLGLGALVYKIVIKQDNNTSFTVNGNINGDVVSGGIKGRSKSVRD